MGLPTTRHLCQPFAVTLSPIDERKSSFLTVCGTLGHGPLATSAAHAHTVDDIALLGLVSQAASLVGTRGTRGAVDDVQLTELY